MESDEILDKCALSTLSEVVDEYLINRGVDKKKHFGKYLVIAKRIWQQLFWKTIWGVKTVWMPLKQDDLAHYIDLPKGLVRLFSINTTDDCGKIVPLFYNNQLNVVRRPKLSSCGCNKCDCGGVCEDVNNLQVVTKLLFTINGINYYEKTWLKYCPNGDVWEYNEIPTKKYLDFIGDSGDYNNDYGDDYSVANPLSNFEIVTQVNQKKVCSLDVKPCGCPQETPENERLLSEGCGGFLSFFGRGFRRCYCDPFLADPAPNIYGQVKISECGTKVYYKAPVQRFRDQCVVGAGPLPHLPKFLQVSFQTDGIHGEADVMVPDFALMAMWTGIDWRSKLFLTRIPWNEKKGMEYQFNHEVNQIILFLSPFEMERLASIQDAPILW